MTSAAFSPDGGRIVTASSGKTARIWDAHRGAARGSNRLVCGGASSIRSPVRKDFSWDCPPRLMCAGGRPASRAATKWQARPMTPIGARRA